MKLSQKEKRELLSLLFPALNICRGIEIELQDHRCSLYQDRAPVATRNLMKLLAQIQNASEI